MTNLPDLPFELVAYLFNLDQGRHLDRPCTRCARVTDQVVISYGELPGSARGVLERVVGRTLDIVPGARLLAGKPTVCACGAVNR